MSAPPHSPRRVLVAALFFVLSGAAALVYQVAWERLLALTTGVGVHSVAIITAAFMAGLGIGSYAGGMISARLERKRALVAFALVEFAVALFALLSIPFYYGVLYREAGVLYGSPFQAALVHFLSLLPPTALMGMSLPFLVRGLVEDRSGAPRTIGVLYGANALGAAAGALLTPWVLLRFLGIGGAVIAGAGGSAAAALGALALAFLGDKSADPAPREPDPSSETSDQAQPFATWIALYALSGLVCLSLEVAWFRVLDVAAKASAFTFGTLLAVYLLGLATGTLVAASRASSIQRPLAAFLYCQIGVVLTTVVAHAVLVWAPSHWPLIASVVEYGKKPYGVQLHPFHSDERFSLLEFVGVYGAMPLALFGPSTFLMGFGFPILQKATQRDPVASGQKVGLLQAANIAGCTLGSLVTGLLLLDSIGTSGTFRVLTLVSAGVALLGWKVASDRRFLVVAGALLALAWLFPGNNRLWRRLHGDPPAKNTYVEEDAAGVTALTPQPGGYKLWINGRHNSWLPYGWIHTSIGALPAIAHDAPEEIAVVGLGSGDTAWAAGCRSETKSLVVFEIASSQRRLLSRVEDQPDMGRLHDFLQDPRVTMVKDDGRRRLRADGHKYDIIVADAIDYDSTMSNTLYSVEYYRLVKETLKPGGLICVLARTPRIRAAVQRALPFTVIFGRADLFLASAEPIHLDQEAWIARVESPRMVGYFGKARVREIAGLIRLASYGQILPPNADVNTDLEPKDEFMRPLPQGD